jgi:hypothetical protein
VIRGVGRGLDQPLISRGSGIRGAIERMLQGVAIAKRDRPIARILAANTTCLIGWILGITLGIPMLMANHPPSGFEHQPLVALSCVLAAYGTGDFAGNIWVANRRPADRWRFMFSGYIVLGLGMGSTALPALIGLGPFELPAIMLAAFIGGWGGPIFFLPMLTTMQTRLSGADIAAIFRLRIALTSASMALAALAGTWMFEWPGTIPTVILAGLLMAATGWAGLVARPPEMERAPPEKRT